MDRGEQAFASATRSRTVGLQVNAEFDELAMLRALVETITLHADFGVDEVTDIRLAVEEVATEALLDRRVPGTRKAFQDPNRSSRCPQGWAVRQDRCVTTDESSVRTSTL
jgi:hypothetical protein